MNTQASIRIDIDQSADAAYIRLSDKAVARTVELTEDVYVDLDELGVAVGVEILSLAAVIPFARLITECHVHSSVVDIVAMIRPSVGHFFATASEASARPQPAWATKPALAPC